MSDHINGPVLAASLDELRYLVFRGLTGATGQSAYELAVSLGFEGTEAEWIASLHGTDGSDGQDGAVGEDGYSPEVTITSVFNGRRIKITDREHPNGQTFELFNGTNGHSPYIDSTTGTWWYYDEVLPDWVDSGIRAEGADGYSPAVTVTQITGGNRVTITDKTHQGAQAHTFDVLDGEDGAGVPDVSGTDAGKVMTVGVGGEWVAAEPLKQVQRVNYYAAASGTHAQGDLTVYSGGAEIPTSGQALANAIADGLYPIVFEVGTSYPRVYHPEMILAGTMITFRSTDVNGNVAVLNVEWNASTATPFSAIGDMPTPDAQTDVGKVPTVNASGGYSLQTPSGGGAFEIPVISSTSGGVTTYAVDSSITAADVYSHKADLVVVLNGVLVYAFNGGSDSGPGLFDYYFSIQESRNGQFETEWLTLSARNGVLSVTADSLDIGGLPAVTTTDNGKFMRVVSGAWAAQVLTDVSEVGA